MIKHYRVTYQYSDCEDFTSIEVSTEDTLLGHFRMMFRLYLTVLLRIIVTDPDGNTYRIIKVKD